MLKCSGGCGLAMDDSGSTMAWFCTKCQSKLTETGWPSWTPANQREYDTYKEAYQHTLETGAYRQAKEYEAILCTLNKQRMEAQYDHSAAIPIFRGPMTTAGREYPIQQQVLDQILIQSHGIPPMQIEAAEKTVRYDHAAAEKATIHPPGCTCAPCVVMLQNKQIAELTKQVRDAFQLAKEATAAEHQARYAMATERAKGRVVADVPVIRVGDTERNLYIEHLGNMYSDGHLTQEEFSERTDKANVARTMDDLRPLVADLPSMVTVSSRAVEVVKQRTPLMERVVTPAGALVTMGLIALWVLLILLGVL